MANFEQVNRAHVGAMGEHRPARTVIAVKELPGRPHHDEPDRCDARLTA
jgi:hypothetical protein